MEEKGPYLPPLQHPNYNASEKNTNGDNPPPYANFNLNVPPVTQQPAVHLVITPTTQQCPKENYGATLNFPATTIKATTTATPTDGWFERNHRNKPQSNSAGAVWSYYVFIILGILAGFVLLGLVIINALLNKHKLTETTIDRRVFLAALSERYRLD